MRKVLLREKFGQKFILDIGEGEAANDKLS